MPADPPSDQLPELEPDLPPDTPADWRRPLGSTGLEVSAVTAGFGSLRADGVATVHAVLSSPITVLDTSNGYGDGASETTIGSALASAPVLPEELLVVTKVDPRGRDYSGDRVRASVEESRARLGLDRLPLVHLHDPESFDFAEITAPGGAVAALVALKEQGVVGAIGLAGGRVAEMRRYVALDVFDVVLVHNRWTLVDRSGADLVADAVERGAAVVNAAVYGGGILAAAPEDRTTYAYRPAPPELLEAIEAMRRTCARHGTDLATAALQFSLRDPRVATTVVGMSRPERVAATVEAATARLPEELWAELEALVPPEHLWIEARLG